jgi:hypothetical protein
MKLLLTVCSSIIEQFGFDSLMGQGILPSPHNQTSSAAHVALYAIHTGAFHLAGKAVGCECDCLCLCSVEIESNGVFRACCIYSHALRNDFSVDEPHIRQWSHKMII